ncbi:MAG: ATP-binding cassette domain-containing protein [Xanthomonadales bacterium]|nr:ATP-binding cassette domain-containing protein [Gammaproteobacteria bacterium]NNK05110.1 ATP-binding cassette domain-containing protein [Xanthomonadales bacterium]
MLQMSHIELRRGTKLLFQNASLQAHAGQRVGVIGVNGSGKSSLFALIRGQLEADAGQLQLNPRDVIAHVAQESPQSEQAALEFVQDGDEGLRQLQARIAELESRDSHDEQLHGLYEQMDNIDGFTAETRAARLLHGLGFEAGDFTKPVNQFSGGWRMRLNLAQALMCRSDILLLDEPTNHLDLPTIVWLERWLKSYTGILLLISHDRDFLDGLCTHIAHIEYETVKTYTGNYSQFEAVRSEQLALQQSMFVKQQKEIKHMQSFVDRFRYKATKAKQAQSRLKMLERMVKIAPAHVDSSFHFKFQAPEKQPQQLMQLEDATAGYGSTAVVSDIRLRLGAGDRIGLLGSNGAGKSTLVKALVDGSTLLSGERTVNKHTHSGYFAQQQLELLRMDESPLWHVQRQAPDIREQDLRNHLGRFGFQGDRITDPVAPFSGGEKARLVLALLVLQKPNLLLLDEPTNHLDLDMRHALGVALMEYSGALLVISHDRHLLRSVCDDLYVVHNGRLHEFRRSLDEYPNWLKEQDAESADDTSAPERQAARPPSKKQNRQEEAKRRQRLKPHMDAVRKIDRQMIKNRTELANIEQALVDESLYTEASRQDEMKRLLQRQAALKSALETLEWEWLEASEKLEEAEKEL